MVQKGVEINAQSDVSMETPLFQSKSLFVTETLLSNGAAINMKNRCGSIKNKGVKIFPRDGETALHYAVLKGDLQTVILLTTWRPAVVLLAKGPKGTAFDLAAHSRNWQILSFLNGFQIK